MSTGGSGKKKDGPLPVTAIQNSSPCQKRRRSDFFLLFIGVCLLAVAIGHIFMHNPHGIHVELTTSSLGGVHGSLEGFVVDGKRRRGKTAGKAKPDKRVSTDGELAKQLDDQSNTNESNVSESVNDHREKEIENADATKVRTERHAHTESSAQSAGVDTNVAAPTTKPTNSPIVSKTTRKANTNKSNTTKEHKIINPTDSIHPVAQLSCADHGGPSDPDIIDSMVFWSDIPSDSSYVSPMYEEGNEKYLTFEPDHGGWNNIRMAMETALVMSHAMGRTLVLPPEQGMYLISANHDGQKTQFSFSK